MNEEILNARIEELNKKLDLVLEEVAHQRSQRQEWNDFKDDFLRVGNDLYKSAVDEFEEMSDSIQPGDFWHLTKKLLRNVNNITLSFELLENLKDFLNDAQPLSRELFHDFMNKLDEFDRKGYFKFFLEAGAVMDRIITSFTPEDVRKLGDNIATILNTVKNLTQPDILNAFNNALNVYKHIGNQPDHKISTLALLRQINDPETKKSLFVMLEIVKNITNNSVIKQN